MEVIISYVFSIKETVILYSRGRLPFNSVKYDIKLF